MAEGQGIVRKGISIGASQALIQACALLRNVVIARLISPADFGVAAALIACVAVVEMLSDFGPGRYLVQAKDGDEPASLATSHTMCVLRGITGGAILLAFGGLMADIFDMQDAAWAFRIIALIPVIRAFTHNGIWVAQRRLSYGGWMMWEVVPQLTTLALALPLGWWLRDYTASLWLLLAATLAATITSHACSPERYRLAWHHDFLQGAWRFGWPLLIDGLLMYALLHGERIIVGHAFDRAVLGTYSAAYLLTYMPTVVLVKIATATGLPQIARAREDAIAVARRYQLLSRMLGAAAVLMAIPFVFAGTAFVAGVYGGQYTPSAAMVTALACTQVCRILRAAPVLGAMAYGNTLSPMLTNVVRSLFVLGAYIAAIQGATLTEVLLLGTAGEAASVLACGVLVRRRHGLSIGPLLVNIAYGAVVIPPCFLVGGYLSNLSAALRIGIAVSLVVIGGSCAAALSHGVRSAALDTLAGFFSPQLVRAAKHPPLREST